MFHRSLYIIYNSTIFIYIYFNKYILFILNYKLSFKNIYLIFIFILPLKVIIKIIFIKNNLTLPLGFEIMCIYI